MLERTTLETLVAAAAALVTLLTWGAALVWLLREKPRRPAARRKTEAQMARPVADATAPPAESADQRRP